jgi:hypothetical protein
MAELDWTKAVDHAQRAIEIGERDDTKWDRLYAMFVIGPLTARYHKGERTQELYDAMMRLDVTDEALEKAAAE